MGIIMAAARPDGGLVPLLMGGHSAGLSFVPVAPPMQTWHYVVRVSCLAHVYQLPVQNSIWIGCR